MSERSEESDGGHSGRRGPGGAVSVSRRRGGAEGARPEAPGTPPPDAAGAERSAPPLGAEDEGDRVTSAGEATPPTARREPGEGFSVREGAGEPGPRDLGEPARERHEEPHYPGGPADGGEGREREAPAAGAGTGRLEHERTGDHDRVSGGQTGTGAEERPAQRPPDARGQPAAGGDRERYVDEHGHSRERYVGERDADRYGADGRASPAERGGLLDRLGVGSTSRRGRGERGRDSGVSPANTSAILALVLGAAAVVSLLVSLGALFFLALPLGIAAMVFGARGKRAAERDLGGGQRGAAKVGIGLGAIATLVSLLAIVLLLLGASLLGNAVGGLDQKGDPQAQDAQQSQTQRDLLEERSRRQREELVRRAARQREELRRRAGG